MFFPSSGSVAPTFSLIPASGLNSSLTWGATWAEVNMLVIPDVAV